MSKSGCFCTVRHLVSGPPSSPRNNFISWSSPHPTGCPHGLLGSDVAQGPPYPHAQNPFKMAKGQDAAVPFLGAGDVNSRVNCHKGLLPFPAAQKF